MMKISLETDTWSFSMNDREMEHDGLTDDERLVEMIVEVLRVANRPRPLTNIANILCDTVDSGNVPGSEKEYWPGYNQAIDMMIAGARELIEGWRKHDRQLKGGRS